VREVEFFDERGVFDFVQGYDGEQYLEAWVLRG
jgi:hypothetical protein